MAISFSVASLRRALVGGGFVQLMTRADAETAGRMLMEASDTAEQQFVDQDGDVVSTMGITSADGGPILTVHLCDSEQALRQYLAVLVPQLEERGISGRLLPARDLKEPRVPIGAPAVSAVLAVELEYDEMISSPRTYSINPDPWWWVSQERTERVFPALVDWCLAGPGDLYIRSGIALRITPGQALRLVLSAKARSQSVMLTRSTRDAMAKRTLYAGIGGEVILQSYEPDLGWLAQLESLRTPLTAAAPDVLNAFVRIAITDTRSRVTTKEQPPSAPLADVAGWWRTAHLERDYVPDAYGQQVITSRHLEHAHDLSTDRWLVEDLGRDRHLVTARRLEDWFDVDYSLYDGRDERYLNPTIPSRATLAQARADFGAAILTSDNVEANPPPGFTGQIRR